MRQAGRANVRRAQAWGGGGERWNGGEEELGRLGAWEPGVVGSGCQLATRPNAVRGARGARAPRQAVVEPPEPPRAVPPPHALHPAMADNNDLRLERLHLDDHSDPEDVGLAEYDHGDAARTPAARSAAVNVEEREQIQRAELAGLRQINQVLTAVNATIAKTEQNMEVCLHCTIPQKPIPCAMAVVLTLQ